MDSQHEEYLEFDRSQLLEMVRAAVSRKRHHDARDVHLILDCGFVIPTFPELVSDVRMMLVTMNSCHASVWLVSRLGQEAHCVCGMNCFHLDNP